MIEQHSSLQLAEGGLLCPVKQQNTTEGSNDQQVHKAYFIFRCTSLRHPHAPSPPRIRSTVLKPYGCTASFIKCCMNTCRFTSSVSTTSPPPWCIDWCVTDGSTIAVKKRAWLVPWSHSMYRGSGKRLFLTACITNVSNPTKTLYKHQPLNHTNTNNHQLVYSAWEGAWQLVTYSHIFLRSINQLLDMRVLRVIVKTL